MSKKLKKIITTDNDISLNIRKKDISSDRCKNDQTRNINAPCGESEIFSII